MRCLDDRVEPGEGATHDEQHVRRVDLDELLVRVLATALRRHRGRRALEDLQQRLLDALARDVAGDRRVLGLAGDLVDLVDVDDPGLGALHVVVGGLDQLEQDVLDVLADVAGLGQRRGVRDRERDVQHPGQRLREQRLAGTGRAEQQDVGLRQLDRGLGVARLRVAAGLDALVVVVDRDGEGALGVVLADHVGVQELVDLTRLGQLVEGELAGLGEFLLDDLVAQVDALVADVDAGASDQLLDLLLALSAERALEQVTGLADTWHGRLVPSLDVRLNATASRNGAAVDADATRSSLMKSAENPRVAPLLIDHLAAGDDLVDDAVLLGLRGGQDLVALDVERGPARSAGRCAGRGSPPRGHACAGSPWPGCPGRRSASRPRCRRTAGG